MSYTAPSIRVLQKQLTDMYPNRKLPDWVKGDSAHATQKSDHNPNSRGSINAVDVREGGWAANVFRDRLITNKDGRLNYVIHEGLIWERKNGFRPRQYTGANAHKDHVHVSILQAEWAENDVSPWNLGVKPAPTPAPLLPPLLKDDDMLLIFEPLPGSAFPASLLHGGQLTDITDPETHKNLAAAGVKVVKVSQTFYNRVQTDEDGRG